MTDSQRRSAGGLVITPAPSAPLSAAQKTFNRLSQQIARLQGDIQDWETTMARTQRRVVQELVPAQQQFQALRRDLLLQLNASSQSVRLGKVARATLSQAISALAMALLQELPEDAGCQEAIQAIYQRHTPEPAELRDLTALRRAVADHFDLSPEEGAEETPESFAAFMERMLDDRLAAQLEALAAERAEAEADAPEARAAPSRKKKAPTRAQAARESQRVAQAEQIRQALRTIYRQLVRVIHPDREADPDLRIHKTALMQRANQAYAGKDLLQLLALQQELGQIDPGVLGTWGEDLLKTYNRVLKEHIEGLQRQVQEIQTRAAACVGSFFIPTRREFERDFEVSLREMRGAVAGLQSEMVALQSAENLKAWLQERRREIRRQEQMDRDTKMYWDFDRDF